MALRMTFRSILIGYFLLSVIVALSGLMLKAFPGDLGVPAVILGPLIFLLPLRWVTESLVYYFFSSCIFLLSARYGLNSFRESLYWFTLLLSILLWLAFGFTGVIYLGFASV